MTASRLLILGALRRIQPAHGYQVRQELELWEADTWARIAYGSIYHALNSMAEEGLLEMHVETERKGGITKKMYQLTDDGDKEYRHLLHEFWWEPKPVYDPFYIALAFTPDIPRTQYVDALQMRKGVTQERIAHLRERQKLSPVHLRTNIELTIRQLEVFIAWIDERLAE